MLVLVKKNIWLPWDLNLFSKNANKLIKHVFLAGLLLCILFAVLFGNVFDLSSKEDKERTVFASVTKVFYAFFLVQLTGSFFLAYNNSLTLII